MMLIDRALILLLAAAPTVTLARTALPAPRSIALADDATPHVRFAAREVQRYVYLRTGDVLPIHFMQAPPREAAILVVRRDQALARSAPRDSSDDTAALDGESFVLRTDADGRIWIIGGGDLGTLYGGYRFAEALGARFYLHGDVVPEPSETSTWPVLNETGRPLFAIRGFQPFHDFAEGPDWWNRDDYFAVAGQMAKLRMNFLGLHTYPESSVGPEPTVWLGMPGEYDERGRVRLAYPASYHSTARSERQWWGYAPLATSEFAAGAAALFERDDFGGEVMRDHPFARQTPESAAEVFNRAGELLRDAFTEARALGMKTCVGTETPLTIPAAIKDRILALGRDPANPAIAREIYTATFDRIARAYPIDYYWLWTPETWTWEGNKPEQFAATAADIQAALDALRQLGQPFTLATCGWVLGPQHNRAALDQLLPPESPMSAINQSVGHKPIDVGFTNLSRRPRWAIPWLENDGALIQPQLWAGRMRYDAADARRLGCDGLLGIHWRTRVLAPNIQALAGAAWDQSWLPDGFDANPLPPQTSSGAVGGRAMPLEGVAPGVLASARVGMSSYDIPVPNGVYSVLLRIPALGEQAGERRFDVVLDGAPVLRDADPATAPRTGLTQTVEGWKVGSGRLRLEFVPHAGEPVIAAIEVVGTTEVNNSAFQRRINCGGPAIGEYEADELPGSARPDESRTMPVEDLYRDFAVANFGASGGPAIGAILARMDGRLHQTTGWLDGPGGITRHPEPWTELAPRYAFVDELERLRPIVQGAANLARFDGWLAQFRVHRELARIGCAAGALDVAMERAANLEPEARALRAETELLPMRLSLSRAWESLIALQIAASETPGELGIIANLEQHNRVQQQFLTRHDQHLTAWLGRSLPAEASPGLEYRGPDRIIVPTVRTSAHRGESVRVRALLAGVGDVASADLLWRPMGRGPYQRQPLNHVARRVFEVNLPAVTDALSALEYRIEVRYQPGRTLAWPSSDHSAGQTVILSGLSGGS